MKRFLLLSFLSLSAHAACDYTIADRSHPEIVKDLECDKNFECLKKSLGNPDAPLDEVEQLLDYSRDNKCNDEIRIMELFERMVFQDLPEDQPEVNNSDRGNSKADLPVIPDAPSQGSKVEAL